MNESANELQHISQRYQAYLVRLWRSNEAGAWRVLAKNVQTGREHHFASLEQYIAFVLRSNADLTEDARNFPQPLPKGGEPDSSPFGGG